MRLVLVKGMEILVRTDDMIASMFRTADPMSDTVVLNGVARSVPCAFGARVGYSRVGLCQYRSSSGMCGSKGNGESQEDEVKREESVRHLSLHVDCTKRIG